MNQRTQPEPTYVMGRSEAETHRLMVQAQLYGRITRCFFEDAGLAEGMKVLDVGSGAGDVAFTAAEIVGPTGSVVGVDVNAAILGTARVRAREERQDNVVFVEGNCRTATLDDDFDAAVGRFVLMYTGDVAETLGAVVAHVRPGGIVAFAEADFSSVLGYVQAGPSELFRSVWHWADQAFRRAGVHTAMAPVLCRAFLEVGLDAPHMVLHTPLGTSADWPGYDWSAQAMRSMLPLLEQYGVVTADELEVDTLAARYRAEVVRTAFPFMMLPLVTAWARKPGG